MEVVHHYCNCFLVYGCSISLVISLKITKVTILLSLLQLLMVEFVLDVKWNGLLLFMPTVTRWVHSLTTSTFFLQIVNGYISKFICSFVTVTFMLEAMATANALIQLKKNKVIINVIFCCLNTSCSDWKNENKLTELCCETGTTSLSRKLVSFSVFTHHFVIVHWVPLCLMGSRMGLTGALIWVKPQICCWRVELLILSHTFYNQKMRGSCSRLQKGQSWVKWRYFIFSLNVSDFVIRNCTS